MPFRLFRAIELGDAAAVRRALADGADPERKEIIPTIVEFWAHVGDY